MEKSTPTATTCLSTAAGEVSAVGVGHGSSWMPARGRAENGLGRLLAPRGFLVQSDKSRSDGVAGLNGFAGVEVGNRRLLATGLFCDLHLGKTRCKQFGDEVFPVHAAIIGCPISSKKGIR